MTSSVKQEDRGDPISLQEQHAATYYAALTNKDRGIPISLFVQTCAMNQGLSKEEAGTLLGKLAFELGYRQLDKPIYSNTLFSWMRNKTTPLWAAKTAWHYLEIQKVQPTNDLDWCSWARTFTDSGRGMDQVPDYYDVNEASKWLIAANKYQQFRDKVREVSQEPSKEYFDKYSNPELALRAYCFLSVYDDQDGFSNVNIAISISAKSSVPLITDVSAVLDELLKDDLLIYFEGKYKIKKSTNYFQ
ncbi:hypothetical protein CBW53_19245 [Yersinia frederiksenii]|nr:hypothetical protein CBW53_19245 [Yersinia frederiksenii]